MNLIALAVPFFLLGIALEFLIDKFKGRGLYRANDAISNFSLSIISTTLGYFTYVIPVFFWAYALRNFAILDLPLELFDTSARGLLLWLTALILWDFCYYWFHRCSHEISIFWAAHAVHHQSEDYNLTTALRQTGTGFLFGWIFYLPLFLIGFPFQVLLTVNAINLIYQFWAHTQLVQRLGVLDRILVTPSNHRVHHAQNTQYIDKNYGGMLIIWDRIFDTFVDEDERDPAVYGIRKPLSSWNPLWANVHLYHQMLGDTLQTKRWQDKIKVWFCKTGWRPADVATRNPVTTIKTGEFVKYDPKINTRARLYVIGQFVAAMLLAMFVAQQVVMQGTDAVLIPCLILWVHLYSIGFFSDGRESAVYLELVRLTIGNGFMFAWWAGSGTINEPLFWPLAGLYSAVSLVWLWWLQLQKKSSLRPQHT